MSVEFVYLNIWNINCCHLDDVNIVDIVIYWMYLIYSYASIYTWKKCLNNEDIHSIKCLTAAISLYINLGTTVLCECCYFVINQKKIHHQNWKRVRNKKMVSNWCTCILCIPFVIQYIANGFILRIFQHFCCYYFYFQDNLRNFFAFVFIFSENQCLTNMVTCYVMIIPWYHNHHHHNDSWLIIINIIPSICLDITNHHLVYI